jgi:3-hydroxyisobutyrate dehydrogenase-like beta-hydroxyacid dehydrogenase
MGDSPIGLIGVGLLGTALAERMLAAGLVVVGFDRRRTSPADANGSFYACPIRTSLLM